MSQTFHHLGTKVCVPDLPPAFRRRARLETVLADGDRQPFTLVSAAPGSGKSTLLAGWFRAWNRGHGAWLTLDARDNVADRLVGGLLGALAQAGLVPEVDEGAPLDLSALDAAFGAAVTDVRGVLVLDDVQELTRPEALAVLDHIVERAPATIDVVVATRADPPLGLARLRLADRIGEVRGRDLAFTLAEASGLFDAEGLTVDHGDVRRLWERTEGWAAGLRLVATSVKRGADPERLLAGAGDEAAELTDYLLHEVLLRQTACGQDFLLRTSVVDRLTPDLARVLSEDPDAGERLEDLEKGGVFLVRLDGTDWFRYHPLLAALLRSRLRQRDPEQAAARQRQAAEWFARRGMAGEAEDLAREGGDWDLLGELLGQRWTDSVLDGGDVSPGMTSGLAPDVVSGTPGLSLVAAAEACSTHDAIAARHHRQAVEAGSSSRAERTSGGFVPIDVVTAMVDVLHGCAFGADGRAASGAEHLDRSDRIDPRTKHFIALRRADLRLDVDDLAGARRELEPLVDVAGRRGLLIESEATRALIRAVAGRLGPAESSVAEVSSSTGVPSRARAIAALASVVVASQRGVTPGPLPVGPRLESRPLHAVDVAVRSWLSNGTAIVDLDDATARHPFAGRALVALGVLEVFDSAHRVVTLGGPAEAAVRRARTALAKAAHAAVLAAVEPWVRSEPTDALPRTSVEAHVLAAAAWLAQGRYDTANAVLRTALDTASSTGVVAPLIAHGPAVVSSLDRLANEVGSHQPLTIWLLDNVRRGQSLPFADPLTDRERVVLCFLPTMMTNAEIAASMHVSVNTVKTHLKAVYRKLDVERRRDAVLRARQLELL